MGIAKTILLAGLALAGCKHVSADSQVKVTNGIDDQDAPTGTVCYQACILQDGAWTLGGDAGQQMSPPVPACPAGSSCSVTVTDCANGAGANQDATTYNAQGSCAASYPFVVELDNVGQGLVCSGTFLSDTTALTAAHCIDGTPASGLSFNGTAATKVFWTGAFGHTAALKNTDLAILIFPAGTAPATTQIAPKTPAAGTQVTLVGYGYNDVNNPGSLGVKREGSNKVAGLAPGFIHLIGVPAAKDGVAAGQQAASAPGDSGGPLFVQGMIAGVDTGGGVHADGMKHSYYVDLSSKQSCTMLATAVAGGAAIDPLPTACQTAAPAAPAPAAPAPAPAATQDQQSSGA